MSDIVEKVDTAIGSSISGSASGWDTPEWMHEGLYRDAAKAAIRATLEHLRDNVSDGMLTAAIDDADRYGTDTIDGTHVPVVTAGTIAAALAQALKELES